ncbi:methylated-DNA--protein-cysteine methyltransferase [Bacteroidia bacterium]|nr:methylated-DNA--protein-cysteine methyltransferase [Bacteroidia bacterium]
METTYYQSPIGCLKIVADKQTIVSLQLTEGEKRPSESEKQVKNEILQKACRQLDEYFSGKRKTFDLPLTPKGTVFQTKVWAELQRIPYGKTISYAQLAQEVDNPKACRAAGSANGKNPIAIVIPCHRVINADGKLGGYAYGLKIKKQLLDLENGN